MDKGIRDLLRSAVEDIRKSLERDFREQLEGSYGIGADGHIKPPAGLTHLSASGRAKRQAIEAAIRHEQETSKLSLKDAVVRYTREAAFTTLNRLAALKLMESSNRRLIRPTLGAYHDSAGFKEFTKVSPQLANSQSDGGYRFFLQLLYDDLAISLEALFGQHIPHGMLFPSSTCLREVLELLNQSALSDIWNQDETIGWIYQFFTPKQQRDQARKASPAPRDSHELAFRNQFYTPRYVVEFLVDNTLGRLWWEMRRGDTALAERCRYLIRPPDQPIPPRDKMDPRELRVLDPASGSGHFLLYGYDVFETIYDEAYTDPDLGPALQHDYPTREDLRRAIPGLILEHNLHGIDIDLRAVQIARLALWLRAQRAYAEMRIKPVDRPRIEKVNIVVAERMPGEKDLLTEFVVGLDTPVRDLVREVWTTMQQADEVGSLLKVENILRPRIAEAKLQLEQMPPYRQESFLQPDPPKPVQTNLILALITDAKVWSRLQKMVLKELRRFAARATDESVYTLRLFSDDAETGMAFVELFLQPFDVVLMNPPFGAASKNSKAYIEENYPITKNDLYAAFIERGLEVLRPRGLLGAITSRTGFFLTSFREWREELLIPKTTVHAVADLGYGVLDTAMVETAAYALEKQRQ